MLEYEDVLEINGDGNYDNLYTLKIQFDLRYQLWKGLEDFGKISQTWDEKVLKDIEVKPMQQQVDKFVKTVNQCERGLSDNPIVPRLKKMVWLWKESLPALNSLKSQFLEEEHILEIA